MYLEAHAAKGITGDTMLNLLERRLDNVAFRLGIAPTIPGARQLINHRHLIVRGRRVDIPSIRVKVGDRIELTERARAFEIVKVSLAQPRFALPSWLEWDSSNQVATVTAMPTPADVLLEVDTQLIVEFYAK